MTNPTPAPEWHWPELQNLLEKWNIAYVEDNLHPLTQDEFISRRAADWQLEQVLNSLYVFLSQDQARRIIKAIRKVQRPAPPTGLSVEPPGCPAPGACGCPIDAAQGDTTPAVAVEEPWSAADRFAASDVPAGLMPVRYQIVDAFIEWTGKGWAVRNESMRLSVDGKWHEEPWPIRASLWNHEHTFSTPRAAYDALVKAWEKQP